MTTNEGGSIPEEYQVLYTRDRTEAVSQVWLGLTAGCAVCHDHKFDPISQREFYELSAFFNNTTQPIMDGNIKDTPPTVLVPQPDRRGTLASSATAELADGPKSGSKLASSPAVPTSRNGWPRPIQMHSNATIPTGGLSWPRSICPTAPITVQPAKVTKFADAGDFDRDHAFSFGAWVKLPRRD